MPIISTTAVIRHDLASHRVSVADSLAGPWILQENLSCKSLATVAGPDIDEATLVWDYGLYAGEFREMKDLDRRYAKIEIIKADDSVTYTWYGIIEVDSRDAGGTRSATALQASRTPGLATDDPIPHGTQQITAYGLLRELERTIVRTSQVEDASGTVITIGRGLPFNKAEYGHLPERGNRSNLGIGIEVFSHEANGQDVWTAQDAINYLLKFHPPVDVNGAPTVTWQLDAPANVLTWYDVTVETDGRNVKEILDDLIDRRRLAGYYVISQENPGGFTCTLKVFTFNDAAIAVPTTGVVIPANLNTLTLDFETAFDIDLCTLHNNSAHMADRIVVQGGFITSTFTMVYDEEKSLTKGWTPIAETLFLDGASAEAGYGAFTKNKKQKVNQQARSRALLVDVFSKFVPPDDWDATTYNPGIPSQTISIVPNADPAFLDFITTLDVTSVYQPVSYPGHKQGLSWKRKPFLDYLPIKQDGDQFNDDDEYIRPFLCWRLEEGIRSGQDVWAFGHDLAALDDDRDDYDFSTRLAMLEREPGIRVEVSNGIQQLVAEDDWIAAADTKPKHDPTKAPAVSYKLGASSGSSSSSGPSTASGHWMLATVAMAADERVEVVWESGNVPDLGQHLRELIISLPDARLDLMAPHTVMDLTPLGYLVQSGNGKILRDDRSRLRAVAEAAGAWYSVKRQALTLAWKQLDHLGMQIGELVTDIGNNYKDPDVKSAITGIAYDFDAGSTRLETAYADLDLTEVFRIL